MTNPITKEVSDLPASDPPNNKSQQAEGSSSANPSTPPSIPPAHTQESRGESYARGYRDALADMSQRSSAGDYSGDGQFCRRDLSDEEPEGRAWQDADLYVLIINYVVNQVLDDAKTTTATDAETESMVECLLNQFDGVKTSDGYDLFKQCTPRPAGSATEKMQAEYKDIEEDIRRAYYNGMAHSRKHKASRPYRMDWAIIEDVVSRWDSDHGVPTGGVDRPKIQKTKQDSDVESKGTGGL